MASSFLNMSTTQQIQHGLQHQRSQKTASIQSSTRGSASSRSDAASAATIPAEFSENDMTSVVPSVKIGVKPLPLTAALVKSDKAIVDALVSLGYDCVLLPLTNARYKENCKRYFLRFKESSETPNLNHLKVPSPTINEINVLTGHHVGNTIGLLSSWVELDNADSMINEFSLQVILNEVSYAQYIGIHTLLVAPPKNLNNLQIYTDNLNTLLEQFPKMQLSISLPMCEDTMQNPVTGEAIPMIDPLSTWDVWNSIRIQCNYHRNLSVSLGSPKTNVPQIVVDRWLLEPIRFYLLSSFRFVPNSKNYPVLNKFNQLIIWKILQRKALDPPTLLLHGVDRENDITSRMRDSTISSSSQSSNKENRSPDPNSSISSKRNSVMMNVDGNQVSLGDLSYLEYLRYLVSVSPKNNQLLPLEAFTINSFLRSGVRPDQLSSPESLQQPLQPHNTSLDNNTYRIFEQDRAKYEAYERAMVAALMDLSSLPQFCHIKSSDKYGTTAFNTQSEQPQQRVPHVSGAGSPLKILVLGPGRGPLIERLFSAIQMIHLNIDQIEITAVERNTNVMIYLLQRNRDHWNDKVNIYNCDARYWKPANNLENNFNLVVSELLGSFGCNELAPECLDAVSKYCDPNAVFIPTEFSSYIAPAISPATWSKVNHVNNVEDRFDRPYMPLWDAYDSLSSKYAKVWTFRHAPRQPSDSNSAADQFANKHNSRQTHAVLKCHRKGTIHGLLGYFSAVLYKNVGISTCPTGNGPLPHDLVSWLPIFFPIDQPIHLTDDQEVSIFMKRACQGDRIWYEWSVEAFLYLMLQGGGTGNGLGTTAAATGSQMRVRTGVTRIHNPNGSHFCMRIC